jgi:hypothetical protein
MQADKPKLLSADAQRLSRLREALLHLHKSLIDSERQRYEKTIGKIQSPNHFFKLLTDDPWFAWLHPLSLLIVSMDEALDEKEPLTSAIVDALGKRATQLLVASEGAKDFPGHYDNALQNDPDVVLAHAEVMKLTASQ